jgi:hypothetical protein
MSELARVQDMLAGAERAASAGNLASADALLRSVARIQEAELGPLHPDLANTLNNLAIVAENTGRPGEAETFYRRAVAITSASLPAEHPMVAASRQNLEEFCRSHGIPIEEAPVAAPPAPPAEPGPDLSSRRDPADEAKRRARGRRADAGHVTKPAPRPAEARVAPPAAADTRVPSRPPPPTASRPLPFALGKASRPLAIAIGLVLLVTAGLLVTRPWSARDPSTAPAAEPMETPTAEPASVPPPAPVSAPPPAPLPVEQAQPPTAAQPDAAREVVADEPAEPSSGAITLATVELCRTLSTRGEWRCDAAGNTVAPGPLVFYTRVRTPRNTAVVHRWYRGDELRETRRLTIRTNPDPGYRTYSRHTVDEGDWRVEARTAEGDLLHERRFAVR